MGNKITQEEHDAAVEEDHHHLGSPTDSLSLRDFELMTVVGKGSFGKVMQVKKKDTGNIYAMKVLKKQNVVQRKQVEHTKTERRIMENVEHPFIVKLRFAFQSDTKLYMVLDYFNGGELFFHLRNEGDFDEDRAKFYAAQIVLAIECLHSHQIVYRDLKPENILLDSDGYVRLTDFGLSKEGVFGEEKTHTFCGTPEYLAPEVLHQEGYNQMVDWWSLGCLLYEMLTGLPPFFSDNLNVMYDRILYSKIKYPKRLSKNCRLLISRLLERNPDERLGVNGVDEIKNHSFFEDIDWEALYQKNITPDFIPSTVDGDLDISNVDVEFKSEKAQDTPAARSDIKYSPRFSNFTYEEHRSALEALKENPREHEVDDGLGVIEEADDE